MLRNFLAIKNLVTILRILLDTELKEFYLLKLSSLVKHEWIQRTLGSLYSFLMYRNLFAFHSLSVFQFRYFNSRIQKTSKILIQIPISSFYES